MSARPWGKILVSTRLEKVVSSLFFQVWMELTSKGLRPGDGALSVRGKVAHKAQNDCVRHLLAGDWDTLLTLDSDADVRPEFLAQFRDYEPGWEYDVLQAFYPRRGWPPRAIWMKKNALGQTMEYFIRDPNALDDVDIAGTHACLIRREVFVKMLGEADRNVFEWFFYPRNEEMSEDGAFSQEAIAAGFRVGATSAVRAGHICEITTTWESYQEYLLYSGRTVLLDRYSWLARQIGEFTGESSEMVIARSTQGVDALRATWQAMNPQTAAEERVFYQTVGADAYLYELLAWNCSPFYQRILDGLKSIQNCRVLVIGVGLGTEAETLLEQGCAVTCYDLPGRLRDFAERRLAGRDVQWLDGLNVYERFDAVVAVDTLEHIHPSEIGATLERIGRLLAMGGTLYAHNNWAQQESYPMHHDNEAAFDLWCEAEGLRKVGENRWSR
mgnify:CR=1 FL=1